MRLGEVVIDNAPFMTLNMNALTGRSCYVPRNITPNSGQNFRRRMVRDGDLRGAREVRNDACKSRA